MARDPKTYTAGLHKEAFELYAEKHNLSAVCTDLDVAYSTITSWSKDFRCPFGCPWHGYEKLLEERTRVLRGQVQLLENGITDDDARRIAAESQLNQTPQKLAVKNSLLKVVKSDLERLAQLELLYNKTYWTITGIPLVVGEMDLGDQKIHLEDMYAHGMNALSFDSGLKALLTILAQIDVLKKRLGLISDNAGDDPDTKRAKEEEAKPLNIKDLAKLKQQFQKTEPEELAVMLSQMEKDHRDKQVVEAVVVNG